jgi:hypothetical protein
MEFFSTAWSWITGSSIAASLSRTALLVYVAKLLAGNTDPNANANPTQPDTGVRLQLDPSTSNQIPVLYGEAYTGGNIIDVALSSDYKKSTYALVIAEVTGNKLSNSSATSYTFKNCYFNNNRVVFKSDGITVDYTLDANGNQDISARDLIKVYFYAHDPKQPNGYSGTTPASYTVMPGWDSSHYPMTGLIYAIVEVTYSRDKNITGLPDIIWHIDSDMKKPGDVLYDYMTNTRYGAAIPSSEIDNSLVALNTYGATGFTYTNTSNQSVTGQITINGLVDTTQHVFTNMEDLAKAASSWISYNTHQGQWTCVINQAGSSIASFTDSNIIGEISISGTSLVQLNNIVNVKYQNTDILDKTDFVKIELPSGDLYANEQPSTLELNLPFTNSQVVASKIGLQALKQARVDKVITFRADYSYFDLNAGDLIDVTNSIYGFTNKVFRIVTISEIDGDDNTLQFEIKALEYDADVYTYNITQYTVDTDDGILNIGSIGKPNTPTVTKTEQSNAPRIVINAVVPSGIIDAMEFWLTFDTGVQNDANRTYIKIGQYSNTNGSVLTENDSVSYTYSGLAQSNFYVKVRGINSVNTGPFSDPSGLVAYVPIVVADTISDNPVSFGGQLMGLGLLTLLNNLDKLFGGNTGTGSLFEKIFGLFNEKTGVDLVGSAQSGSLVVASNVITKDEGNILTQQTASLNFVGDGVTVTGAGNDITVTINGTTSGGTGGTGGTGTGGTVATTCFLTQGYLYPPDKSTNTESYPEDSYTANGGYYSADHAPITGYYAVAYGGGVYADLIKGAGNIYLYKSDGTLVQTLSASNLVIDKNIVKIPFSNRTRGTDYYILMDGGVVKNASGCLNPAIADPKLWNFNTPWDDPNPYDLTGAYETVPEGCVGGLSFVSFGVRSYFSGETLTKANRQTDIRVNWGNPVVLGTTGKVKIYANGSLVQTINANDTFSSQKVSELIWTSGNYLYIDPTVDFAVGASVYVTIESGVVKDACGNVNPAVMGSTSIAFTVDAGPVTAAPSLPSGGSINESPVSLTFDRPVVAGSGNLVVYDGSNNVLATIPSNSSGITYTQGVT